ncbi:serine-aspartate repeat-containing protein C-like [Physella acuta]|uniref:serine-aspartate repeat-containing protein C-like n=1 Tax=Physella acuta TaxID=109671 RepID=UPI0027DBAAE4|nr:serine-aspartate repeat-containing protein C-like [Physella acuta]
MATLQVLVLVLVSFFCIGHCDDKKGYKCLSGDECGSDTDSNSVTDVNGVKYCCKDNDVMTLSKSSASSSFVSEFSKRDAPNDVDTDDDTDTDSDSDADSDNSTDTDNSPDTDSGADSDNSTDTDSGADDGELKCVCGLKSRDKLAEEVHEKVEKVKEGIEKMFDKLLDGWDKWLK